MTPPLDFSVLLLAWDEADPYVAVLGGAALPSTRSLVYRLAAEQPVLALYPHLPEAEVALAEHDDAAGFRPVATAPSRTPKAGIAAQKAVAATETTEVNVADEVAAAAAVAAAVFAQGAPGVRRLVTDAPGETPVSFASFLVGLEDVAATTAQAQAAPPVSASVAAPLPGPARSQWPTGANAPQRPQWEAPAAPYAGASPARGLPPIIVPVPTPQPSPTVREAADLAHTALSWPAGFSPLVPMPTPAALTNDSLNASELQEAPILRPEAFEEPTEEVGAAEANDLDAPEDDLTLDAPAAENAENIMPAPQTEIKVSAAFSEPVPSELTAWAPSLDGLNYRMIQYARQAAQLVRGRTDFGVIYAPNWPAWLAALEIRNSTGQRLVLYVTSLASSFLAPAERGWLLEVERMTLRRAHLILVPTENLREQLHQAYGAAAMSEVRVVPADDESALQAALRGVAAG